MMMSAEKLEGLAARATKAARQWKGDEVDRLTCVYFAEWATEQAKKRRQTALVAAIRKLRT